MCIESLLRMLTIVIWVLIHAASIFAQGRSREEIYSDMLRVKSDMQMKKEWAETEFIDYIHEFERSTDSSINDSLSKLIQETADNESLSPRVRQAAVYALREYPLVTELAHIRNLLTDQAVTVPAAAILVEWGYWDEGSPILVEHEAWRSLLRGPQEKAEPILRDAATNGSKTVLGRVYAGLALSQYDDVVTPFKTIRAVLREYLTESKPYTDTLDFRKAVHICCDQLILNPDMRETEDIQLFEAGINYPDPDIRFITLGALSNYAWDDPTVKVVLDSVARNSPFPDVTERARKKLAQIEARDRTLK